MKHINVSIFVPHAGCPHQCSFCNQKSISGKSSQPTPQDVEDAAKTALKYSAELASNGEIAFFGGSFTAIDRDYMISLLQAAQPFIGNGGFKGIRISTRPDAINDEICDILKKYNVTAVELGAQSTDDKVLSLNRRGHTREDIIKASNLLKSRGFELGLQMMTGLYGSDDDESICTAKDIIALKPKTVRIYPTVVLKDTPLAELYQSGEYNPQTVESAAKLCAKLLLMFEEANITVIRLGLHSGGDVESGYIAGAYHPAFRELCENRIYFDKITTALSDKPHGKYIIFVPSTDISKAAGQRKSNITELKKLGYDCTVKADSSLSGRDILIETNG
ncbi:MAG: radical SAM protein [Clostridia bacterium]|nr:radical SAM protein [Clostridia bacterium]